MTEATYLQLRDRYRFEARGQVEIKGKGKLNTYWLMEKLPEPVPGGEAIP
ncbi:adenylate/guanylate cyclase domain-containing protein [Spirulina subsalsa FACHB-351]|uniref:Adenylate/guanylate cyclase domain-containing protein n=1 Tax=Spirulina subsalsa FACHB-351 TaxID=234711 RepID=A0ABT3L4G7_9CYAN|nr:adenylate/guanylate cyclase domain-containing protein [Spirulina subsalsa]MCW6036398.1 adenylate/guanylate cyclase domain-containing protein [Spirulina subsalsa FACHB-351]